MRTIAIIGNGYWSKIMQKYTGEYFNVKYVADSKFDLNKIWNDKEVDGVIIATPIDMHFEHTFQALQAEKHVLVEKPVAMNTKEANEIVHMSKTIGKQVGVEYTQTFSKAMDMIKRDLPLIGDVYYIEMSTKHLGRFTGFDVYWLLASHHLSILDMFYQLDTTFTNIKFDDHTIYDNMCATGTIYLDGPKPHARIDVSLEFPGKEMYATFYGDKGTIKYVPLEEFSVSTTIFDRVRGNKPDDITSNSSYYKMDEKNNLKYSLEYFNDLMEGTVESNLDMAVRVTNILCR